MKNLPSPEIWFVTGSQHLYGEEMLKQVAAHSRKIVDELEDSKRMALPLIFKSLVTTPQEIRRACQEASGDPNCGGVIFWMHTFSPSKMWIGGLRALRKPFLVFPRKSGRGKPVAMAHSNTCTSDLNAWVDLFREFVDALGVEISQAKLFELLYKKGLTGDADGGGLLAYNYLAGEPITHLEEGRPLFVRTPESRFSLSNFMRVHLFSALGTLKIGMDILFEEEKVKIDKVLGHGGFFKTEEVGQRIMAAALNVPVSIMETAGEGGAWNRTARLLFAPQKRE